MNSIHDMGGMDGFGPIDVEPNEPVFHSRWEARVQAMCENMAGRLFQAEEHRYAIERMPPVDYLETAYYARWLLAAETVLVKKGIVTEEELRTGRAERPAPPLPSHRERPSEVRRLFKPGDHVRTVNINPKGHTRLPRYARGKSGVVRLVIGPFLFPDANAHRADAPWESCYAVEFSAAELWGPEANASDTVCIDLWESYLQKVEP